MEQFAPRAIPLGSSDLVQQSDAEKLAVLWTKAQPTVAAYVSSLIPDFHQAEDVLHEVATILVRKFGEYDVDRPFLPWAMGIARLEIRKHRERMANERVRFSDDVAESIAVAYEQMADKLQDQRRALRDCLARVEGRSREALRLRYIDGLKPAAIAERLRVSAVAARTLLTRVRASLRDCITLRLRQQEST